MDENPQGTDIAIARQCQKRHLAAIWAKLAGLEPGMIVADIGCGPGVLTREYAAMLGPAGLVYAIDNRTTYTSQFTHHQNVRFLFQNYDSKIILEQTPKIVFLTDKLQHLLNPEMVLHQIFNASGKQTTILITSYHPNGPGHVGTKLHRRMAPEIMVALVEAAGLRHSGIIDSADEHYALIAHK